MYFFSDKLRSVLNHNKSNNCQIEKHLAAKEKKIQASIYLLNNIFNFIFIVTIADFYFTGSF